ASIEVQFMRSAREKCRTRESYFCPERPCLLACIGQREVDRAAYFLVAGLAIDKACALVRCRPR
ncbi:MAG: hypothetical protein ABTR92_19460, partial [Candidatus Accumulibacter phosphatis]